MTVYSRDFAKRIRSDLFNLEIIHRGVASMHHGIMVNDRWIDYYPTHFVYSFFAFNSLYNVNWEKSLTEGQLSTFGRNEYEYTKQDLFINFCFNDTVFTDIYKPYFLRFITSNCSADEIISRLKEISFRGMPRGLREDFISNCQILLSQGTFNRGLLYDIIFFLYKIRNNVFHGAKSVKDMEDLGQQDRLNIYSSIIIGINQMVFSYLDYIIAPDRIKNQIESDFLSLTNQ